MQNHICVSTYNFWKTCESSFKNKTLRKRTYQWLLINFSLTLSGCMGIYEGGFECPPGKGVGCKSTSEVNHMINAEILPAKTEAVSSPSDCKECDSSLPSPSMVQESSDAPQIWWVSSQKAPIEEAPSTIAPSQRSIQARGDSI